MHTLLALMLVSTGWVSQHLKDPSVVVLHVGTQKDYDAGHLPGARLISLTDISAMGEGGLILEMPPVEKLEAALGKLGVTNTSRVVVYAGTDAAPSATRVWFTLDYAGMGARASLMDGGFPVWKAEGRAVSNETPAVTPAKFTAHPRKELIVDAAWVSAHLKDPKVVVLDARLPEFYSGASAGNNTPRAGHIAGARNVPFSTLLDPQKKMKPAAEVRRILDAQGKTPVSYCHVGLQATVLYFAARYAGLQPRLYDGSFQDWSRRMDLPVEPHK